MFKARLLSGIVLVAAAIALVTAGGDILLLGLMLVSLIGQFELYRIFHIERTLVGAIGYLGTVLYYLSLRVSFLPGFEIFVLGLLGLMCLPSPNIRRIRYLRGLQACFMYR